jgi:hypothetical protein
MGEDSTCFLQLCSPVTPWWRLSRHSLKRSPNDINEKGVCHEKSMVSTARSKSANQGLCDEFNKPAPVNKEKWTLI